MTPEQVKKIFNNEFVSEAIDASQHPAAPSGAMREKLAATPYDLIPYQELSEAYARVAEVGAKKVRPLELVQGAAARSTYREFAPPHLRLLAWGKTR